nr:hypothetical protein [Prevotella sp.]
MQIKTSYNGEPFVYIIPNENPLSCFYLEKEKNGIYALYIGHMSIKYLQRVCIRKEYYKVEELRADEKVHYPTYKAILERLDSYLYFMSDKIELDSLTQINIRTGDLAELAIDFSYNWEKNNDILKDRTDFDQFSIAINQTSLNKDINSILEKYSLRVDTITSGIEPKALGIPLEEFAKSRGIKKMNQNMPKIITDAPIRVTCKSVRM